MSLETYAMWTVCWIVITHPLQEVNGPKDVKRRKPWINNLPKYQLSMVLMLIRMKSTYPSESVRLALY